MAHIIDHAKTKKKEASNRASSSRRSSDPQAPTKRITPWEAHLEPDVVEAHVARSPGVRGRKVRREYLERQPRHAHRCEGVAGDTLKGVDHDLEVLGGGQGEGFLEVFAGLHQHLPMADVAKEHDEKTGAYGGDCPAERVARDGRAIRFAADTITIKTYQY